MEYDKRRCCSIQKLRLGFPKLTKKPWKTGKLSTSGKIYIHDKEMIKKQTQRKAVRAIEKN